MHSTVRRQKRDSGMSKDKPYLLKFSQGHRAPFTYVIMKSGDESKQLRGVCDSSAMGKSLEGDGILFAHPWNRQQSKGEGN